MTSAGEHASARDAWLRALQSTAGIGRDPVGTLALRIGELADTFGERVALLGDDESLSYRALAERANRYARWALEQGVQRGDVICLVMHNCPEYLACWLGITRTGAIVSLVNTNLVGESLAHAIRTAAPKHIVVGAEHARAVGEVLPRLHPAAPCSAHGVDVAGMARLDEALARQSTAPVTAAECAAPTLRDQALYIYTSGTTGLPKAARVSHYRIMQWSCWFAGLMDTTPDDRVYDCLPMYHSVGGVVAIGAALVRGGSVVLRRRFSARGFWDDVSRTECTLFQYIGELCRFLLSVPPAAGEREHRIRIACGNGLRPDVWEEFQSRFAIPRVLEFYAATEANFSLYNCEGRPGAIGRIPPFLAHRFAVELVALDTVTDEPERDAAGRCRRCAVNEVGEAISRIANDRPEHRFEGYTDHSASERKILRDVFAPGDAWYRSGDLMRRDASGFFYFVDRVGDTFRWKGENVSTGEVTEAVAAWREVREAAVYGVEVPGSDGRAGMAAVVVDGSLDLAGLQAHLTDHLPEYARPVFVRIIRRIEKTGTFKPQKQALVRIGFDPGATPDALFVHDRDAGGFIPLTGEVFARIRSGRMRL